MFLRRKTASSVGELLADGECLGYAAFVRFTELPPYGGGRGERLEQEIRPYRQPNARQRRALKDFMKDFFDDFVSD